MKNREREQRIVMLDFDGVMNKEMAWYEDIPIDPVLARRVGGLVMATDAQIVVSSDWRRQCKLDELKAILEHFGSIPQTRVIDTTEIALVRGKEIQNWLLKHGKPVRLAILDDNHLGRFSMDGVRTWFVKTDPLTGFSGENLAKATELLTTGPVWSPQLLGTTMAATA